MWRQPKTVWSVAFACVVAFMGIGLVDPILKPIAEELGASPSQVSLLFTSYMAVMGVAMLGTGWVSSRIGPKRTLLLGLTVIIIGAGLAGTQDTIAGVVGWRAVWGLGNALFIATALATIVRAARGSVAQAIILYEAALGLGIAAGPLLGGVLGGISWRWPFFGVSALMLVALVTTWVTLPDTRPDTPPTSLSAPLKALRHRGLATVAVTALLYNVGFFTLLAFTPFPLDLSAHGTGLVFFGWGLFLAIASVFIAPRVQRRIGTVPGIVVALVGVRRGARGDGPVDRQQDGAHRGGRRGRRLPRRQQHVDHRDRDDRVAGRARGGLVGLQLRAVRRWRGGAVHGGQARRDVGAPAVLGRGRSPCWPASRCCCPAGRTCTASTTSSTRSARSRRPRRSPSAADADRLASSSAGAGVMCCRSGCTVTAITARTREVPRSVAAGGCGPALRARALRGQLVVVVVDRAGPQRQAAAADARREVVADLGHRLDPGGEQVVPAPRHPRPVALGRAGGRRAAWRAPRPTSARVSPNRWPARTTAMRRSTCRSNRRWLPPVRTDDTRPRSS